MSETTHAGSGISPEQAGVEKELVDNVVASFDKAEDPRLKEVMQALTRHLHNFLREVRLTDQVERPPERHALTQRLES